MTPEAEKPLVAESTATPSLWHRLRLLRWRALRLWHLPEDYRVFTPAFSGLFLLTMVSLGATAASWMLVRLLPNRILMERLTQSPPDSLGTFWELLKTLPGLLAATAPSTTVVTGALVGPEAFTIAYACGAVSIFCLLLLLLAFVRRW